MRSRSLLPDAVTPILAALFVFLSPTSPVSAQNLTFNAGDKPTEQIAPNAAYGSVRYDLRLFVNNKPSSASVFDALLNGLGGLLKQEGTYTLTIEVLGAGDEVLSRRAIVSVDRRKTGWFIFNRVVKENEATEWYGDLLSNQLLRPDTNNVRIRVRSYYSKDAKLDLTTFNLLADIVAKTKLLGAANTALEATWKPLAQQIEGVLGSYEQSDVSDVATLSFARFNADPNPSSGIFVRQYRIPKDEGPDDKIRVEVRVETTKTVARVATLIDGKVPPFTTHSDVLAAARIADQPIDLLLATSTTESVKGFLSDLNSTSGFSGADIGERCDRVSDELSRNFTVTDKVISYWALLNLYRRKIAANSNARDCLASSVKKQMTSLGLSLDDLPFARDIEVAEGPGETPRRRKTDRRDGDGTGDGVERQVAKREVVEKLLGEKNVSETFQVFRLEKIKDE